MDGIFTLQESNKSLATALLIFYLIVASNFTEGLFSKQLRTAFQQSRLAQHIIGFIMMLVIVMLIGGVTETDRALLYAGVGYVWFILSTKLDAHWNIMILLILLFAFLYESRLNERNRLTLADPALSAEEKQMVIERDSSYKTYVVLAILGVTLVGTGLYLFKKTDQYGGSFDPVTFLFY